KSVNSLRRCSLQSLGSLPAGAKFGLERATPICSAYRCHGLLCEGIPCFNATVVAFGHCGIMIPKAYVFLSRLVVFGRSTAAKLLSEDEARRIASNIATDCVCHPLTGLQPVEYIV